jgi:hypothetical protein
MTFMPVKKGQVDPSVPTPVTIKGLYEMAKEAVPGYFADLRKHLTSKPGNPLSVPIVGPHKISKSDSKKNPLI